MIVSSLRLPTLDLNEVAPSNQGSFFFKLPVKFIYVILSKTSSTDQARLSKVCALFKNLVSEYNLTLTDVHALRRNSSLWLNQIQSLHLPDLSPRRCRIIKSIDLQDIKDTYYDGTQPINSPYHIISPTLTPRNLHLSNQIYSYLQAIQFLVPYIKNIHVENQNIEILNELLAKTKDTHQGLQSVHKVNGYKQLML